MIQRLVKSLFALIALLPLATAVCFAQSQTALTRHVRDVTQNGQAQRTGALPASNVMRLSLVLPLRNRPQLNQLLQDLYNPSSASFHKFLTVADFTQRFGPTQADYTALTQWAQSKNLAVVKTSPNRVTLDVTGSVQAIQSALNVTLNVYQHPTENRTFYAPDREPTPNAPVQLWHIAGLDNYSTPHPAVVRKSASAASPSATPQATLGSCPSQSFCGSDMRAAYYQGSDLTGAGQSLGLLEFLGTDLDDLNTYFANIGQTNNVPITLVSTDGTDTSCVMPQCDDLEQTIDMTQALGMAPGLSSLVMYVGSSDVAMLNAMATANPLNGTLSSSWTWAPADPGTDEPFFQEFAAQGQSYFQAAGDSGVWGSFSEIFPAEDPFVTAVGGTSLVTQAPGGAWSSETTWFAGGGGVSPDNLAIPYYQTTTVAGCSSGCSSTLRNAPDVSANSDYTFYVCADQTTCTANLWGGTSFAAPMWAGYIALANQLSAANGGPRAGFINPTLYNLGVGSSYATVLHDITLGTNGDSATQGYDLATGWGSPNSGTALMSALTSTDFFLSATPSSITVAQGATSTFNVTLTSLSGFSGTVDLSVNCPSGLTCTFNPQTVNLTAGGTATATLTINASGGTGGSFKLTLTGTSGSLTHTGSVNLTVVVPNFSISSNPVATSVDQGSTAQYAVALTSTNGFSGSVALSAAGCPADSKCSFSPSTVSVLKGGVASSVLTVKTANKTPAGSDTITITGTSGSLSNPVAVQLTIFSRK